MEKGQMINQAYEILKQTYLEIYKLKDDIAEILRNKGYDFSEEYSYGGRSLNVVRNHTFLFKKNSENESEYCEVLGIVVLFDNDGDLKKISLKDEPEIWFLSFEVKNSGGKIRPWSVYSALYKEGREWYDNGSLRCDSIPYNYFNIEEKEDTENKDKLWSYKGKVLGTSLTSIQNKDSVQELIEKLF